MQLTWNPCPIPVEKVVKFAAFMPQGSPDQQKPMDFQWFGGDTHQTSSPTLDLTFTTNAFYNENQ